MGDLGLLWPLALVLLLLVPLLVVGLPADAWGRLEGARNLSRGGPARFSYTEGESVAAPARPCLPGRVDVCACRLGTTNPPNLLYPDDMSGIMLAVETSRSMGSPDIEPTRLAATQAAARALIDSVPSSIKMGLTTFSGYGALNVPLTNEHSRVKAAVDSLSVGGSYAFSDGLITSLAELPVEDPEEGLPGAIVLFSHGHDNSANDPLALASEAAARGIKIHTVGVGTHGNNFSDDILKLVADRTGGEY